MSTVDNERPPYLVWETRQVEDRAATIAAGHYVGKDVDFVTVQRAGARDTLDKEALVWLAETKEKARQGTMPAQWHAMFQESYKLWKDGQEPPVNGTPILGWTVLSPAAQKTLISVGIKSVEDLAEFSDSELSQVGTGAMQFKQKAKAWLLAAKDTGKAAEQIAAQGQQITELVELVKKQAEEIKALSAQLPKQAPAKV